MASPNRPPTSNDMTEQTAEILEGAWTTDTSQSTHAPQGEFDLQSFGGPQIGAPTQSLVNHQSINDLQKQLNLRSHRAPQVAAPQNVRPLASQQFDQNQMHHSATNSDTVFDQDRIYNDAALLQDVDMTASSPLELDDPNYPYSYAPSLESPCMELGANGQPCSKISTYLCQSHEPAFHRLYYVCIDCHYKPNYYSLMEEIKVLEKNCLYLCHECTEERCRGPIVQEWEHPLREKGETRERKEIFCKCNDRLTSQWICRQHRVFAAKDIETWGLEKARTFRNFFQGEFCPACRTRNPKSRLEDGVLMWLCACCDDLVIDRTFQVPSIEGLELHDSEGGLAYEEVL